MNATRTCTGSTIDNKLSYLNEHKEAALYSKTKNRVYIKEDGAGSLDAVGLNIGFANFQSSLEKETEKCWWYRPSLGGRCNVDGKTQEFKEVATNRDIRLALDNALLESS